MSNLGGIIGIIVLLLFGGLFIVWRFLDREERRRVPPEKLASDQKDFMDRLLRPDWEFYERHLQRSAPVALRELFADRTLVASGGLKYSKAGGISSFNPLDKDSLVDSAEMLGFDIVPFATSDCGDAIFLRPGKDQLDTVYIAYHDDPGKGLVVLADSVAAMLQVLRKVNDSA